MKLITAIINKEDSSNVCSALTKAGFMFTKIATYGGFLRSKNMTLLIGAEDEKIEVVFDTIRSHCSERTERIKAYIGDDENGYFMPEVTVGGATVFVTDIEKFEKV